MWGNRPTSGQRMAVPTSSAWDAATNPAIATATRLLASRHGGAAAPGGHTATICNECGCGRKVALADAVTRNQLRLGFAGGQPFVDDDMTSFDRDAGVFEADVFDIADDPDGEDDALDGELAPLPSSLDARDDILAIAIQGDGSWPHPRRDF